MLSFEKNGVTVVVRRQNGGDWRSGHVFCIRSKKGASSSSYHLVFLRKTARLSGTDVLEVAERCCKAVGGRTLSLQDQATKRCPVDAIGGSSQYDLGFRTLLIDGMTWYEKRGYVISRGQHHVRSTGDAIAAYKRTPVSGLENTIERQVARLVDADEYRRRGGRRWEPMDEMEPLTWAFDASESSRRETKPRFVESDLPWLLWHRRRLLKLLRTCVHGDDTLGTWLPGLSCREYAAFMYDMYGALLDGKSPAIYTYLGTVTPSVREFVDANAHRRWAFAVTYTKVL
jgi:hypothetical protein